LHIVCNSREEAFDSIGCARLLLLLLLLPLPLPLGQEGRPHQGDGGERGLPSQGGTQGTCTHRHGEKPDGKGLLPTEQSLSDAPFGIIAEPTT
jgi:hypothetical protein